MTLYQQGDVLIQSVEGVKGNAAPHRILAQGEATGHAHRLSEASDGLLYEDETIGTLYLRVGPGGATVEHEEHQPITLPPGEFAVRQVREYDHFTEEARQVKD